MPEDLATDLLEAMADLTRSLEDLARRVLRSRVIAWALVIVVAFSLWQGWELRRETQCTRGWAVAYTQWQEARIEPAQARVDASDAVFRSLAVANADGRRHAFDEAFHNYLTVSDRYAAVVKVHPLPPEPRYTC